MRSWCAPAWSGGASESMNSIQDRMKKSKRASDGLTRRAVPALLGLAGVCAATGPVESRAEIVLSLFSGLSLVENNDLDLHQPGADLTFHDVSYETRDFNNPLYYGARIAYFLPKQANWGFGLEFIHGKMYLETDQTVHVTGHRGGVPVNGPERIDNTVQHFSVSHGLNVLAADVIYRWFLGERDQDFLGRFQPYLGGGLGVAIPHVESNIGGVEFEEYQWDGPAYLGLAGLNFDLARHLGLFIEYKASFVQLDDLQVPGGFYEVNPLTHHFVTGISFRF